MELLKSFFKDEEGVATLEIVLIVVVLIGLALLFKSKITKFVENILNKISGAEGQFEIEGSED